MTTHLRPIQTERVISDFLHGTVLPNLLTSTRRKTVNCPYEKVFSSQAHFTTAEISKFANLLLQFEIEAVEDMLSTYLDNGHTASNLILNLLCSATRHLGDMWCVDECSFADVTIGMAGAHQALRLLNTPLKVECSTAGQKGSILLVAMADDTHVFGISVLEAFFRNSGWCVDTLFETSKKNLIDKVAHQDFQLVGLSIAQTQHLAHCDSFTKLIRDHSANKKVKIIAGGQAVAGNDAHLASMGIDAVANDVPEALKIASRLCRSGYCHNNTTDRL